MVRRPVSDLLIQPAILLSRGGWLPGLALVALLTAATLHFWVIPETRHRTDISHQQIIELQSNRREQSASEMLAVRYAEVRAQLTDVKTRGDVLKTIFKIASETGVSLAQADYRMDTNSDCGCQQLQITMPVRGAYPQIRAFIDAGLAKIPSLALNEITIRRENVKNPNIEARLRFSLFLREGQ